MRCSCWQKPAIVPSEVSRRAAPKANTEVRSTHVMSQRSARMPAASDLLTQPYSAMELAALLAALMAAIFAALWSRDHERGMGWFALSMALLALWLGTNRWHLPPDDAVPRSAWAVLPGLVAAALTIGMARFLPLEPRWRRLNLALGLLLAGLYVAPVLYVLLTGAPLRRDLVNLPVIATYAQLALMCFWGARREPGAGFFWVGLCLLAVVPLAIGLALAQVHGVVFRYWGVLPVLAMQPMLLIVILMRRHITLEAEVARRAAAEQTLTDLNASLEQQVAQRTSDLVDIIQGLESFNRSVSHDLRGPLGGIAGAAELAEQALQRGDAAAVQRMLSAIGAQALRSTALVDALLRLARVRDAPMHPQPIDIGHAAREVVEQLRLAPRATPFPTVDLSAGGVVHADPDLLRVILTNLIANAAKFAGRREQARIEIAARALQHGVEVSVCDNGVGFEPHQAERLFQPFRRLHGNAFEGSGVGLSIVQRAVQRLGGRVSAESAGRECGACFRFTLPAAAT
jgi:signal transduction histidine kinase